MGGHKMPKESKVFSVFSNYDPNGIVYHRESFGWELNSVSDNRVAMHRETTIPNYHKLTQYERDYDQNLKLFTEYEAKSIFSFKIFFILLLIFVLPGVLYIMYKGEAKKKANFHLSELERISGEARLLHFSVGEEVLS